MIASVGQCWKAIVSSAGQVVVSMKQCRTVIGSVGQCRMVNGSAGQCRTVTSESGIVLDSTSKCDMDAMALR